MAVSETSAQWRVKVGKEETSAVVQQAVFHDPSALDKGLGRFENVRVQKIT